jgi:hypothetical protein
MKFSLENVQLKKGDLLALSMVMYFLGLISLTYLFTAHFISAIITGAATFYLFKFHKSQQEKLNQP